MATTNSKTVINESNRYVANQKLDVKSNPLRTTGYAEIQKGQRVKLFLPKTTKVRSGTEWIRINYVQADTNRESWVLSEGLSEDTSSIGKSYIFYMPPNDSAARLDKMEIVKFFGYENPDKQVVLVQLDENLIATNASGGVYKDAFDSFIDLWNGMDDSLGIDVISIMTHGNPNILATEPTHFSDLKDQIGFLTESSLLSYNEDPNVPVPLDYKNISLLFLHACSVSQYNIIGGDDNRTIARLFGKHPGIGRVVGPNTNIVAAPPAEGKRPFNVTNLGHFIQYRKGVQGVEPSLCDRRKYTMDELLDEIFNK